MGGREMGRWGDGEEGGGGARRVSVSRTSVKDDQTPIALPAAAPNEQQEPQEPLGQRLRRWLARGSIIGAAVSLAVHLLLLIIAALWVYAPGRLGSPEGSDGLLEINITLEQSLTDVSGDLPELDTTTNLDNLLAEFESPSDLTGLVADDFNLADASLADLVDSLSGAGGGDATNSLDIGGAGAGGGAGTSFFGVEASGNRFAFIVDISGSMQGAPILILQRELTSAIDSLLPHMTFAVLLFNHTATPLIEGNPWIEATGGGKQRAIERIMQIQPWGGTDPRPAFARVFSMRPRPDAIYFMTDGIFETSAADDIAVANVGRHKVAIHCITFIDNSAAEVMQRIAEDSGGTYTHVPGPGS